MQPCFVVRCPLFDASYFNASKFDVPDNKIPKFFVNLPYATVEIAGKSFPNLPAF
jgi:hypothetical protein